MLYAHHLCQVYLLNAFIFLLFEFDDIFVGLNCIKCLVQQVRLVAREDMQMAVSPTLSLY